MSADEETSNNTQLHRAKVRSIHGQAFFFCKACMESVHVDEHVTGITKESEYNIYWDYAVGTCGHVIKEWSH
jgi:hypothetical protein